MDEKVMQVLCDGVELKDGMICFVKVKVMEVFSVWLWNLFVCFRQLIFISWVEIIIIEGRNR